jgi:ribosomal RNA-processing protein 36
MEAFDDGSASDDSEDEDEGPLQFGKPGSQRGVGFAKAVAKSAKGKGFANQEENGDSDEQEEGEEQWQRDIRLAMEKQQYGEDDEDEEDEEVDEDEGGAWDDVDEDEDEGGQGSESDEDEEEEDDRPLEEMSFAELEKLRKSGNDSSSSSYFQRKYGTTDPTSKKRQMLERKRASKNAPREISSKKQVGRFKEVAFPEDMREKITSAKPHDPRFSKRHGKFNADLFKKSYGFLDEHRKNEMERMQKDMGKLRKRSKGGGKQGREANAEFGEIQAKYSRMQQQMVEEHRTEKLQEVKRTQRKKEQGPFVDKCVCVSGSCEVAKEGTVR